VEWWNKVAMSGWAGLRPPLAVLIIIHMDTHTHWGQSSPCLPLSVWAGCLLSLYTLGHWTQYPTINNNGQQYLHLLHLHLNHLPSSSSTQMVAVCSAVRKCGERVQCRVQAVCSAEQCRWCRTCNAGTCVVRKWCGGSVRMM